MNAQTDKPLRILRVPELLAKTGLKKSHQQQLEQRGEFPKRIKLSERASGWLESEVDAWIAQRVAQSRSQEGPQPNPITTNAATPPTKGSAAF